LDALNYLQSVAFTIDRAIYSYASKYCEPRAPSPELFDAVIKAEEDIEANLSDKKKLKKARSKLYFATQSLLAVKLPYEAWKLDMGIARRKLESTGFWFPSKLDFRGRVLQIPYLNFQRADCVRGLFLFAAGSEVRMDPRDYLWLYYNAAARADGNNWDWSVKKPSKLSNGKRVIWAYKHREKLIAMGNAVLSGNPPPFDLPEDEPLQFLSACRELSLMARTTGSFKTYQPITIDATCSGAQHIILMMRDEIGAKYVNLLPGNEPEDLYAEVARRVYETCPAAQGIMTGPDDRSVIKWAMVPYLYGSKPGGWLTNKKGKVFGAEGMTGSMVRELRKQKRSAKGAHHLARAIYDTADRLIPSCKIVREYLQKLAKICAGHNVLPKWDSPLDLPIINDYFEKETETYVFKHKGQRQTVKLAVGDTDEVDALGSIDGITANVTHSMDACHLHLIALAASKENIPIVGIHDCVASTAPNMFRLFDIVRETLAQLYKNRNVLTEIREAVAKLLPGVELPAAPQQGDLDIRATVMESTNFWR
jgi:DNA-directed RNA polymerase